MERMKVAEAATVLGVSQQFIRIGLQRSKLPIGTAVKMSGRWTYHISPYLLEQYVGIKKAPAATGASVSTSEAERTVL